MAAHEQQQQHQHLPAPPPTPSSHLANSSSSTSVAADALSRLLHRIPPSLSLPTRRPPISLSSPQLDELILSASTQHGFFQLSNHNIPSQLANSAELQASSLFNLSNEQKQSCFPKNWPLGFDDENDQSFWLDGSITYCNDEYSNTIELSSLREFSMALKKLGLHVVDMVSKASGFSNPFREDPTRVVSILVVNGNEYQYNNNTDKFGGGFYPYVVGLKYQIRAQKYSLLSDSGWMTILPEVDSVLVTIGDIAQVWSNGKLKKIRGRPVPNDSRCISMSMLITLPLEMTVLPFLPNVEIDEDVNCNHEVTEDDEGQRKEEKMFSSFSFEDYAWRVYNEPFLFKDPLDRYRI